MKLHFTNVILLVLLLLSVTACKKEPKQRPLTAEVSQPVIDTLPQDIYEVQVNKTTSKALILMTPAAFAQAGIGRLMIFNEDGKLIQYKETESTAICFRRWIIDGQIRYTYIVQDVAATQAANMGNMTGYVVIADSALNEIKRVNLLSHNDIIAESGNVNLDVHDFILLSDDHYIAISYYPKHVNNIPSSFLPHDSVTIIANIIQEVQNGQVIWQWDGTEYPEFYTSSYEGNHYTDSTTPQDYMHMNSMFIDPNDDNLICSFRNLDQVLKIERGTGNILWRLGGKNSDFPLSSTEYFLRQHHATINADNRLMLFDNGLEITRQYSRVLEFDLNELSKTVQAYSSFKIPASFSQFMGSVQKTKEGNYFIGGGTGNYALEINPETEEELAKYTSSLSSYRAYKYELE